MKIAAVLGHFPLIALVILPCAIRAQQPCIGTMSYSPLNPVAGQTLTFTLNVQVISPVGNDYEYVAYFIADGPNAAPTSTFTDGDVPTTYSFSEETDGPGPVTAEILLQAFDGGSTETPVCGDNFGSFTTTVNLPSDPSAAANGRLSGQYAFLFQGLTPQEKGSSNRLASVGSFTADGQGNVTAGFLDMNSGSGSHTRVAVTGTYLLDATGHGTLNLSTSAGSFPFEFFVPTAQLSSSATRASLLSTSGYFLFGNGTLAKQTLPAPLASGIAGSYSINFSGDLSCSSTCTTGAPIYESGLISLDGQGNITGDLLGSAGSSLLQDVSVTGTNGIPDATTGRFTYRLSQGQYPSVNFVGYPIDATHFFTMSTDTHATTYLLSGVAAQ